MLRVNMIKLNPHSMEQPDSHFWAEARPLQCTWLQAQDHKKGGGIAESGVPHGPLGPPGSPLGKPLTPHANCPAPWQAPGCYVPAASGHLPGQCLSPQGQGQEATATSKNI